MGKKYEFKYIVIGSGPAGTAAALRLAKAKKSVALVEGRFYGGANLNTRDIPYGVALDFSHHFTKTLSYPELKNQDFTFNFPTIAARQLSTIIKTVNETKKSLEEAGVVCLSGYANFLDAHTIAINQRKITAEYFILATGSQLKTLGISGTDYVNYLTPEAAIKAPRLPQVVAVVGGGSTGCEIAEYFAELGSKVLILEMADRLLPHEDTEVSAAISDRFSRQLGINVLAKSKVVALEQDEYSKSLIFHYETTEKLVRVDTIVLATGSQPFLDYGLENAGIKYKNTGITVDKYFQTSAKNIYAVGDCIGSESSTDRAHYEGTTLASNLVEGTKTPINYKGLVRITNTYPQVAVIGLTENDLLRRDRKCKKALIKFSEIPAGQIYNFEDGFVKLLADSNKRLIGATIVAPHASLMIEELALALRQNISLLELASTPHIINDYSQALRLAARKLLGKNPKKR